jgi:hypothetical protein
VGKLLGFDFTVEYKPGAANTVADALSRCDTEEGAVLAVSAPRFNFIERLRQAQSTDPALVATRDAILAGSRAAPWALCDGMVTFNCRLYVLPSSPLLQEILTAVHEDGHEGVQLKMAMGNYPLGMCCPYPYPQKNILPVNLTIPMHG